MRPHTHPSKPQRYRALCVMLRGVSGIGRLRGLGGCATATVRETPFHNPVTVHINSNAVRVPHSSYSVRVAIDWIQPRMHSNQLNAIQCINGDGFSVFEPCASFETALRDESFVHLPVLGHHCQRYLRVPAKGYGSSDHVRGIRKRTIVLMTLS